MSRPDMNPMSPDALVGTVDIPKESLMVFWDSLDPGMPAIA